MKKQAAVLAGIALLAGPGAALAQNYPAKPIRIVVPQAPGSQSELFARMLGQEMSKSLGQAVVNDARPGAGGAIGAEVAARSAPDGYTLLMGTNSSHAANPAIYSKLPYDAVKDFAPIALMVGMPYVLSTHPSLPVKNVKDFVALAKKRPGEIVYASAGNGSYVHLSMALLASMMNLKMIHVPYKGGGPAGTALVAGETQAMLATIGSLFGHIQNKRVRPLGVSSEKRQAAFPDVPAIAEFVPGYEFTAWVGSFAPKGVPKPIIDKLNAELKRALSDPGVAGRLSKQTLDPFHLSPEQFAARIKSDYDKYEKVVKISGARID